MLRSLTSGVAGLKTHQMQMDVIGNNIANVNTKGFKSSRVLFKDVFYQTINGASGGGGSMGGTNASQIGYGTTLSQIATLFTQSGFSYSGKATDCAIDGDGFFIVGSADLTADATTTADDPDSYAGADLKYTRTGAFEFDVNGTLVDANGYAVYGWNAQWNTTTGEMENDGPSEGTQNANNNSFDGSDFGPIRVPDTSKYTNISVGQNGDITAIDITGEPAIIGKVAVATFKNFNGLTSIGNSYYTSSGNSGDVMIAPPTYNGTGTVKAGYLEMSNVDLSQEFSDMIVTQRGFQANSRIITVSDEMLEELVNLKR